jgi:hypothetical protein
MKKELEEMRIRPGANGGATVTHEYKRQPVFRKGNMNGGFDSDRPKSEDYPFGPEDAAKLTAHITQHLGLKNAKEEAGEAE